MCELWRSSGGVIQDIRPVSIEAYEMCKLYIIIKSAQVTQLRVLSTNKVASCYTAVKLIDASFLFLFSYHKSCRVSP